ncbi:hypothetical protein M426DRAFT_264762 [Hypoxylon sp. CI-4A]|nr:hypothetical protein M426DRAFT_264762 [Hypoxylon sp. CI-4A]
MAYPTPWESTTVTPLGLTASERAYLLAPRSESQEPPPPLPNHEIEFHGLYAYQRCQQPIAISIPYLTDHHQCTLIYPQVLHPTMQPYLTHANHQPPVTVVPRAESDDAECALCGPHPRLHAVTYLCAFHFGALGNASRDRDLATMRNLQHPNNPDDNNKKGIRSAQPAVQKKETSSSHVETSQMRAMEKTFTKFRDVLAGSLPDPATPLSINQRLSRSGAFGYVGRGRPVGSKRRGRAAGKGRKFVDLFAC